MIKVTSSQIKIKWNGIKAQKEFGKLVGDTLEQETFKLYCKKAKCSWQAEGYFRIIRKCFLNPHEYPTITIIIPPCRLRNWVSEISYS